MDRCERCGRHWPWTRTNEYGLCESCQKTYLLNLRNAPEIISKKMREMKTSDNVETRWQSGNAVYEKLLRMNLFCEDRFDLYAKMFPGCTLKETLAETERQLDFYIDVANKIEAVVFHTVTGDLTVSRTEIDKAVIAAIQNPDTIQYFSGISQDIISQIQNFDYTLFGLYLGDIPTWNSILVLIPILSGATALATSVVSMKMTPGKSEAKRS